METIIKAEEHECVINIECSTGKWVTWIQKQEQRLATYEIGHCVVVAIINKKHGFLQHFSISSQEMIDHTVEAFLTWWDDHRDNFPIDDSRIFIFMSDLTTEAGQEAVCDE